MNKIEQAIEFAKYAHRKQERKYTGEPYIVHPFSVAGLVASVSGNDDMIAAAFLHDVVEDCDCTIDTIEKVFGEEVAYLVERLTDVSRPEDGNRKARKALDRKHIGESRHEAKTIKLADLIDNTKSIVAFDEDFAKVYMVEKRALLGVLEAGDRKLYHIASKLVSDYFSQQGDQT